MNAPVSLNATSLPTLAALAIFNGLRLSPLYAPASPALALLGPRIAPRFNQVRNYLTRFFTDASTVHDFCPVEELGEKMAAGQWVRGAVGVLQHALYEEYDMDIPDASDIDPAIWFNGLVDMVELFRAAEPDTVDRSHLADVIHAWHDPGEVERFPGSRNAYLHDLYSHARELQAQGRFLTSVPSISKARAAASFRTPEEEAKAAEKS